MKMKHSTKGFTLVEIMIVVVIIGLLAAMAIPAFQKARRSSRAKALLNDARQLGAAAQQYFMETGATSVTFGLDNSSTYGNVVTGDLSTWVAKLNSQTLIGGDSTIEGNITNGGFELKMNGAFSGAAVPFDSEGKPVGAATVTD